MTKIEQIYEGKIVSDFDKILTIPEIIQILEINDYNINYLSLFTQGINSNGKLRDAKIKIDKKAINNFLIYTSTF